MGPVSYILGSLPLTDQMNFQRISEGGEGGVCGHFRSKKSDCISFYNIELMFIVAKMKYVKNAIIFLGNLQNNFPKEGAGERGGQRSFVNSPKIHPICKG